MAPQKSEKEVSYSCRKCGYLLNLSSADEKDGSKLLKMMSMGSMSFNSIDESRFYVEPKSGQSTTTVECECNCMPRYQYENSRETLYQKAKLLCRNCQKRLGIATHSTTVTRKIVATAAGIDESKSESGISYDKTYKIKRGTVKEAVFRSSE